MVWTAFVLGLAGSLHCIGMCGPIALALPVPKDKSRVLSIVLYNSGRVITYGIMGMFFGLFGQIATLAGMQQSLSILCGGVMVAIVVLPLFKIKIPVSIKFTRYVNDIKQKISVLFGKERTFSMFFIGLLNGLLPCGLVYMALAAATATGSLQNGIAWMVLFGLGTVPAMFAVGNFHYWFGSSNRNSLKRVVPVVSVAIGMLLIVRGLNLGIPYISPKVVPTKGSCCRVKCH